MHRYVIIFTIAIIAQINGQLSFRSDPYTNSFTIQTPSSQQTFTRYFGQQHGNLLETAESRQQPQQQQLAPQANFGYNYQQPGVAAASNLQQQQYAQQLLLQQQAQQQAQQQPYYNQQQLQAQQAPGLTAQDFSAYFQTQQQQILEAQQIQQQAQQQAQQPQPQHQYVAPLQQQQQYSAPQQQYSAPQQQQSYEPQTAATQNYQQQAQAAPSSLGVSYSPSNEVSNVKFTSSGLNYNF